MNVRRLAVLSLFSFLSGCQQAGSSDGQLAEEITELKKQVTEIEAYGMLHREELNSIRVNARSMELSVGRYRSAVFDPTGDGSYSRLDTEVGPVLVSLSDIQPFADGTRAKFELGNVSAADILNPAITLTWNRKPPSLAKGASQEETIKHSEELEKWMAAEQVKKIELTQTLRSGYWNLATVNLPGIPPQNLGEITVTMNVSQVQLKKPTR